MRLRHKAILAIALAVTAVTTFAVVAAAALDLFPSRRGDTSTTQIEYGDSALFTREELEAAAACVMERFRSDYGGCKLLRLWYEGDALLAEKGSFFSKYDAAESDKILLYSDFYSDDSIGDTYFEQDETYRDWMWMLARDGAGGEWRVIDAGRW